MFGQGTAPSGIDPSGDENMAWNSQGGGDGPWSRGPNGGSGGSGGPWGKGPGGGGQPPDIDEILRRGQEQLRRLLPKGSGNGRIVGLAVVVLLALWGLTGIYKVNPEEIGVVLRFGKFVRTTQPGLNYHLPAPIETVVTPAVTRINHIELGYRSSGGDARRPPGARVAGDENLMLTGDENIIDINFSVFWQINDPVKYLFDIKDPDGTVKIVAESAMREIIGQLPIRAPLFENRQAIGDSTRKRMQELLDQYGSGISVSQVQLLKADPPAEVIDAFNDVQRAKADQERLRNEAEAYRNDIIPRARGESEKIVQEAEAYKEQVTDLAQGEAKRFTSVYQTYRAAPEVTARRLYIETMEQVLKDSQKIIVDPTVKNLQTYLPLPELGKAKTPPPAPQAGGKP
jgi:membrane protease subunit HflK